MQARNRVLPRGPHRIARGVLWGEANNKLTQTTDPEGNFYQTSGHKTQVDSKKTPSAVGTLTATSIMTAATMATISDSPSPSLIAPLHVKNSRHKPPRPPHEVATQRTQVNNQHHPQSETQGLEEGKSCLGKGFRPLEWGGA